MRSEAVGFWGVQELLLLGWGPGCGRAAGVGMWVLGCGIGVGVGVQTLGDVDVVGDANVEGCRFGGGGVGMQLM